MTDRGGDPTVRLDALSPILHALQRGKPAAALRRLQAIYKEHTIPSIPKFRLTQSRRTHA